MCLLLQELNYDELYKMELSFTVVNKILERLYEYRSFEKLIDIKMLPRKLNVVFADCLSYIETSDAFYTDKVPNTLFIDPYSPVNQWTLIAHELIHHFQGFLYMIDESYEELEDMAHDLQEDIKNIICNKNYPNIKFEFVTKNRNRIYNMLSRSQLSHDSRVFAYESPDGNSYLYEEG